MSGEQFEIVWEDHHRDPQCPSNPDYPNGIDIDVSRGREPACTALLPYPAKGCGLYIIHCRMCNINIAVTTAGRPDDPRSVRVSCKPSRRNATRN